MAGKKKSKRKGKESAVEGSAHAVKGAIEAVPVYQDVLQPTAKELGRKLKPAAKELAAAAMTAVQAVNVALAPVRGLIWSYEKLANTIIPAIAERFKGR